MLLGRIKLKKKKDAQELLINISYLVYIASITYTHKALSMKERGKSNYKNNWHLKLRFFFLITRYLAQGPT